MRQPRRPRPNPRRTLMTGSALGLIGVIALLNQHSVMATALAILGLALLIAVSWRPLRSYLRRPLAGFIVVMATLVTAVAGANLLHAPQGSERIAALTAPPEVCTLPLDLDLPPLPLDPNGKPPPGGLDGGDMACLFGLL